MNKSNKDKLINLLLERIATLEYEVERLDKELKIEKDISDGMLETIEKAIEYIKDKYAVILADDLFLDHDERIERKRLLEIIEILKGSDKE